VVCDNNFNVWTIGTRTQFNIDSNTYLGLDVVYEKLETGLAGMVANYGRCGDRSDWSSGCHRSERVDGSVPRAPQLLSLIG
jgi:hypothetical protein